MDGVVQKEAQKGFHRGTEQKEKSEDPQVQQSSLRWSDYRSNFAEEKSDV